MQDSYRRLSAFICGRYGVLVFVCVFVVLVVCPLPRTGERFRPEVAVIRAIHTIHTAQVQYNSQYGRYAASLGELSALLEDDLARGSRVGYRFTVTGDGDSYSVVATNGNKSFCSDQKMLIRKDICTDLQDVH